jgi:GT2 family glycosyltransferase
MDHVSIVIVHYNTEPDTLECLKSLTKIQAKGFKYSVVIVDNASKEPLVLPQNLEPFPFEVIRSESNLGFTGGNNLGVTFALDKYHSDFVVLLNSDTIVDPEFVNALFACAQANPRHGLIGSKIYFYPDREFHHDTYAEKDRGQVLWYAGGSIDWPNLLTYHRGVDEVDRGHFDQQLTSDFATGCCLLIRREVLEEIGLLDERYFLYLEDVDLSVRAQEAGYQIGFCPDSIVWHKNAGSSGGAGSPLQTYYQTRNRLLFGFKHGSWRNRLTTASYLLRLLKNGTRPERIAAIDLVTNKLGKRVII